MGYSHWALAHARLLDLKAGGIGFFETLDAAMPTFALGRSRVGSLGLRDFRLSGILEIHADTATFRLLASYAHRAKGPIGKFNLARAQPPGDPQRLAGIDAPQSVQLCITAAAVACIVLEGYDGGRRAAHRRICRPRRSS